MEFLTVRFAESTKRGEPRGVSPPRNDAYEFCSLVVEGSHNVQIYPSSIVLWSLSLSRSSSGSRWQPVAAGATVSLQEAKGQQPDC